MNEMHLMHFVAQFDDQYIILHVYITKNNNMDENTKAKHYDMTRSNANT